MSARVMYEAPTEFRAISSPRTITLLGLVSELVKGGTNDREVVGSVMDLVSRGCVCLIGQVVEQDLLNHSTRQLRVQMERNGELEPIPEISATTD
jgi:hypothetical protein